MSTIQEQIKQLVIDGCRPITYDDMKNGMDEILEHIQSQPCKDIIIIDSLGGE